MIDILKNRILIIVLLLSVLAPSCNNNKERISMEIEWSDELIMPDVDGKRNPGTAGAYIGINNDYLIIAGGAFFPDAYPWRGGKKHWSKDVYALDLNGAANTWKVFENKLPQPIAYGASVNTSKGILCIGGCDANNCYNSTYMMSLEADSVKFTPWIPLPYPLANCCAAIAGNTVYVAGGQYGIDNGQASHTFLSIDIDQPEKGWRELPSWDGPARGYAVGVAKHINGEALFYLFSGRNYGLDINPEILYDAYVYNAHTSTWKQLEGYYPLMAAAGCSIDGNNTILLAGGTDGSVFKKEMELKKKISSCLGDETRKDSVQHYQDQLNTFFESVQGFDNVVRQFDTASNSIVQVDSIAYSAPLTTTMLFSRNDVYIVSGEIRPGVRSPYVLRGTIKQ